MDVHFSEAGSGPLSAFSPEDGLLLPNLDHFNLEALLDGVNTEITADDLMSLEPWSRVDSHALGNGSTPESSSESSPLHSPLYSTTDSSGGSPNSSLYDGQNGESRSQLLFGGQGSSPLFLDAESAGGDVFLPPSTSAREPPAVHAGQHSQFAAGHPDDARPAPKGRKRRRSPSKRAEAPTAETAASGTKTSRNSVVYVAMPPACATPVVQLEPVSAYPPPAVLFASSLPPANFQQIRPKASLSPAESTKSHSPPAPKISGGSSMKQEELSAEDLDVGQEAFTMKREQRKIRNREAAQLSRQRRKEYLETLRRQLEESNRENDRLKQENHQLKETIDSLRTENEFLKGGKATPAASNGLPGSFPGSGTLMRNRATAACLLTMLFLVAVSWGPLMKFTPESTRVEPAEGEVFTYGLSEPFHSRSLMNYKAEEEGGRRGRRLERSLPESEGADFPGNGSSTVSSADCLRYFNQSESLRLSRELSSWAERHEFFQTTAKTERGAHSRQQKLRAPEMEEKFRDLLVSPTDEGRKGRKESGKAREEKKAAPAKRKRKSNFVGPIHIWDAEEPGSKRGSVAADGHYEVQLYSSGSEGRLRRLIEALGRRDDTFYLVSFRRDYLLLPATVRNSTAGRPRMSLLVPALPLNESMRAGIPPDHVPMMQIECEVTGTGLLHLPDSVVQPPKKPRARPPPPTPDEGGRKHPQPANGNGTHRN